MLSFREAPQAMKVWGRRASRAFGAQTATYRRVPDFIVVGAQRSGTTSLFRALMEVRGVRRANLHKGVNYFDVNYFRGMDWYKGHFPLVLRDPVRRQEAQPLVFEASGYYMYHPFAMQRVAADLPSVRLVAMLRDPVERAFSAWKHESARGFEWEDFSSAIALEDERMSGEVELMGIDPRYQSFSHRHHSYRRRGEYFSQLRTICDLVGRERLHVMYSEDFFSSPVVEFEALAKFLGVEPSPSIQFGHFNARPSDSMPRDLREDLRQHYSAEREALEELVGREAPWPR